MAFGGIVWYLLLWSNIPLDQKSGLEILKYVHYHMLRVKMVEECRVLMSHLDHFLSLCPSVSLSLDKKLYLTINIRETDYVCRQKQNLDNGSYYKLKIPHIVQSVGH